jgi:hypothetical protein
MEDDMNLTAEEERSIGNCIQVLRRIREEMKSWVSAEEAAALAERIDGRLREIKAELEEEVRECHTQLDLMRRFSNARG